MSDRDFEFDCVLERLEVKRSDFISVRRVDERSILIILLVYSYLLFHEKFQYLKFILDNNND